MRSSTPILAACLLAAVAPSSLAQNASPDLPPPVQREFRAAWVATVGNIDWPSRPGLSTWEQQQELLAILNRCADLKLNAVILQVRPGTDALYASPLEPWSEYLTGRQGRAPEPAWDPLAFAIAAAHERGLELHAWLNPYRARYARPISETAATHVSRTRPGLVRQYGRFVWMDPGEPAVRALTLRVVADIVKRYDVDGIHIDDYFYPYRENDSTTNRPIDFPDSASYARYVSRGGTLSRDDWRRENVNLLVRQMDSTVHATKRWVRFGVSPIGIWRPGNPPTIQARFDAYQEIYADTRTWLREGWLDYWVPQLYWQIDSPQRYVDIMQWWAEQNVKERHLWIGNAPYKIGDMSMVGAGGNRAAGWHAEEIVEQVRRTRATVGVSPNGGATGNVYFSMKSLMRDLDSVTEKLAPLYADPALVPATTWLDHIAPPRPTVAVAADKATGEPFITITPAAGEPTRLWVVRTRSGGQWSTEILASSVRRHRLSPAPEGAAPPDRVVVSAVDRVGNESLPRAVSIATSLWERPATTSAGSPGGR